MQYTLINVQNKKTGDRYTIRMVGHLSLKTVKKIARANSAKLISSHWLTNHEN